MKAYLGLLLGTTLAVSAVDDKALPADEIVCFSDSAVGTEVARAAARFLSDRRQQHNYSKSFVVTEREDRDSSRYLILILSPEGDGAFDKARQEFDDALLALLQKMKTHFGDDKVSVILQHPDKSNMMEAYFDARGAGALKGLSAPATPPACSPSPFDSSPTPENTSPPKI